MTREEFLLKIGLTSDEADNQSIINEVLNSVREAFNKEFKLNIKKDDFESVLKYLDKYGKDIKGIVSESNGLKKIGVVFEGQDKKLVSVNTQIKKYISSLKEIESISGKLSRPEKAELIGAGKAYDMDMNLLSNKSKTNSVAFIDQSQMSTTLSYQTKQKDLVDQVVAKYKEIISLQKSMTDSNWKNIVEEIQKANSELNEYKKNSEIVKTGVFKDKGAEYSQKISANDYNKILELQNKITQSKIKEISSNEKDLVILKNKRENLEEQLDILRKSSNLNTEQSKGIQSNQSLNNRLVKEVENTQKQSSFVKELSDNLNRQLSIEKELSKLDSDRSRDLVKVRTEELNSLRQQEQLLKKQIDNKQEIFDLEKSHNAEKQKIDEQKDIQKENKQIEEAVRLYKELLEAENELYRLQSKSPKITDKDAYSKVLNEQVKNTNDLKKAHEESINVELRNGKAIKQTTEYQEQATRAEKEALSSQNQIIKGKEKHTSVLGKLGSKLKEVAMNTLEYGLAWNILGQADQVISRSVEKILDLDKAMTDIQVVTNQTNEEVRQTINEYADMAYQLGVTTEIVSAGSLEWLCCKNEGHLKPL